MRFKMVVNGFWNIYTVFTPDMYTLQHIHRARGTQYEQNKRRTTDTD